MRYLALLLSHALFKLSIHLIDKLHVSLEDITRFQYEQALTKSIELDKHIKSLISNTSTYQKLHKVHSRVTYLFSTLLLSLNILFTYRK